MVNEIKDECLITEGIRSYEILQQKNGGREVFLKGNFCVSEKSNYPVISVFQEDTGIYVWENMKPKLLPGQSWEIKLWLAAGHMYRIETGICLQCTGYDCRFLGRGTIVREVGVGEIFVIAGQSNAAGYGHQSIMDRPHPMVHMKNPDGSWEMAAHPLAHVDPPQISEHMDVLNAGHSAWLPMAKLIADQGTPVGLIMTALNGSGIQDWGPGQPLFENLIRKLKESKAAHVIWYQGCTDVNGGLSVEYSERLRALMKTLGEICPRRYMVQIDGTTNPDSPSEGWSRVREAQRRISCQEGALLIPTYDLTAFSDDIHLSSEDNLILAHRVYQAYRSGKTLQVEEAYVQSAQKAVVLKLNQEIREEVCCEDFLIRNTEGTWHCPERLEKKKQEIWFFTKKKEPLQIKMNFGRLYRGKPKTEDILPYFDILFEKERDK